MKLCWVLHVQKAFFQSAASISHPTASEKQINMTLGIQNWLAIIKLETMKHTSINSSVILLWLIMSTMNKLFHRECFLTRLSQYISEFRVEFSLRRFSSSSSKESVICGCVMLQCSPQNMQRTSPWMEKNNHSVNKSFDTAWSVCDLLKWPEF